MGDIAAVFAANLKRLRDKKGLTQAQLAEKVALDSITIANYEGRRRWPKRESIKLIAGALDVKQEDLFCGSLEEYLAEIQTYFSAVDSLNTVLQRANRLIREQQAELESLRPPTRLGRLNEQPRPERDQISVALSPGQQALLETAKGLDDNQVQRLATALEYLIKAFKPPVSASR